MKTSLYTRDGLPDALRILADEYPRQMWEAHINFSTLTRFWLDRHIMFRRALTVLQTGAEHAVDRIIDPHRHAADVSRVAGFILQELHMHHTIEDQHYFPILMQQDARLETGFEILDEDHHCLDAELNTLAEQANAVISSVERASASLDTLGQFHSTVRRLNTFLDRHLTDEEDLVVPVILKYVPKALDE